MLEFMKLGFAQIAFGGEGGGGGGGDDSGSRAPTSSPRPIPRPTPPAPAPRDDGPSDAERNRQAMLAAQMQQEQRGRAAQEAAAAEAERQRQAAAQAEANRQAQAARAAAERQRQAEAQAEANRQAQAAREAAERQRQQQEAARRMEEQQRQEDEARQRAEEQRRQEQALAAQRAQEQREREQREAAAVAAEAARRQREEQARVEAQLAAQRAQEQAARLAQEQAAIRAQDEARLAEQRNQEAAARRAQEEAAIRAEQARAGIETLAPTISAPVTYTPRDDTFVESILNVEDILAPDEVFQGPTLTGPGYTVDPNITVNVDPDTGFITSETIGPPSGILTTQQAADQAAAIQAQQQAYQDMLARLRASQPPVPSTPAPVDFVPSQDLRDERGSVLPPARDLAGTVSIGYGPGQVDPSLAQAANLREGQPAFAQTTGPGTIEALYGVEDIFDLTPTPENLADLTLATGRTAETQQLLAARPDLVLPPTAPQTVVATGQVPAGTPGAAEPRDLFMRDEVQVLIDASPQARQVYESLGLTPFRAGTVSGVPATNYRDAQGRTYSQAEALDFLRAQGAQTTTLPGGYTAVAPLGMATPIAPVIDLGLTPVDIATPVTVIPGGGGGGGGTRGGGAGRGDPRDFGFVAEEAAASRGSPAGIEGLLERSPTLGQPATTTVPQASDIILPGVETSPTVTREPPPPLAPPGGEEAPSVDVTIAPRDEVGGEPDAAEEVEIQVDTGDDQRMGVEEDTGTGRKEPGAPGGGEGDKGAGEGVEVDIGAGEDEGAGTGGEGTGEGEGEGTGEGPGTGTGTGGGEGEGEGEGTGTGTGEDTGGEDVEVDVVDEDAVEEEEPPVEEEEPAFECPPGFRRVQMANGGFTCVPEMVRPRIGPYTQPVSVAPLAGRTPFRPGTRRT